jgi:hypothetical protein
MTMSWTANRARVEEELEELGIPSTPETRRLLGLLATEPHTLYRALSRLGELYMPAEPEIPPVDRIVGDHLARGFPHCTEPSALRKAKPISVQCKRLLAVLLRDLGTPVPLAELLLANGLRSATPRRLRELENEHGAFRMKTYAKDRVQHYVLESPEPDAAACARYWIKSNLRGSSSGPPQRVLGLLSAYVGEPVARREVDYVLPEKESPGRGLARAAAGQADEALADLRARGYAIDERDGSFVLRTI